MKYPDDFMNKIIQGDCLEVMKEMPDKCVDMILCDLPYGTTQNEWDNVMPLNMLWDNYERLIKDNAAIVLTAAQPFTTDLINSNRKLFRYDLIWYKALSSGFLNAKRMPLRNHEHILVFYKSLPTYNPIMRKGIMKTKGGMNRLSENYGKFNPEYKVTNDDYYPKSVLDISNGDRTTESEHPTQKPVTLFSYLIKTYSNEGDTVLDNCLGSGTTAVACKELGRNFIGIEKEEKYCKIAEERLRILDMQPKLF